MESPVPPPVSGGLNGHRQSGPTDCDINRDPGLKFVTSWLAKIAEEEGSSPPPLEQLSPIPGENSQDSITVQVGTTDSEAHTPIVLDRIRSTHRRRSRRPMTRYSTSKSPTGGGLSLQGYFVCGGPNYKTTIHKADQ